MGGTVHRSALTLLLSTRRCAAAPREDWKVQSVPTGRGQSMSSFVCSPPVGLSAERRWCFAGSRTRSDGYRKPPRISQVWRCQTHLRGLTPLIRSDPFDSLGMLRRLPNARGFQLMTLACVHRSTLRMSFGDPLAPKRTVPRLPTHTGGKLERQLCLEHKSTLSLPTSLVPN